MGAILLAGIFVALAYELSQLAMQLPGGPNAIPPRGDNELYTKFDLAQEFGGKLPNNVITDFGEAVSDQLDGNLAEARFKYQNIRTVPYGQQVLNLAEQSKAFRHNWNLLERDSKS